MQKLFSQAGTIFSRVRIGGVLLALILIIVTAHFLSPYFLTEFNLKSVIRSLAFISIVAIGQAGLLIIGELDLSVGAMAGLTGILGGLMMVNYGVPPFLALFFCLCIGALLGIFNGLLVTKLKLHSLVVTIGTTGIFTGLNLVLSKGKAITGIPKEILFFGQSDVFGKLPFPFVVMLGVLAIYLVATSLTPFGRYMYAIGNSLETARILGIRVDLVRISVFMIAGILSALAGILMLARLGSAQPTIGDTWVLNSIAAPVIGGVPTTGGMGSPFGALLGAAIIGVIENLIVLKNVSPYWQTAVSGTIVVCAIALDSFSRNRRKA